MMDEIKGKILTGERALFGSDGISVTDSIFDDGESPLKESKNITLNGCMFKWKYPLWYCKNVNVNDSAWFTMARAGVWYTENIKVSKCAIEAPKNFRRCKGLEISDTSMPNALETLWNCDGVKLDNVTAKGEYFAMNSKNITADGLTLYGDYSFDGAENVIIRNSRLLSKDAFWNSKNVTVYNSFVSGEYLGWNSENLTLIDCTIESLQGMCYIDKLVMKNCKLLNTTLAFEYSDADVEIDGSVDSVFNPSAGTIKADRIGKLIIETDKVDKSKTKIVCAKIDEMPDRPEFSDHKQI